MKRNIKKIFLLLAVVMMAAVCLAFSASAKTYSGTCGDSVNWSLNTETGKLTIKGSGEMNCNYRNVPWSPYVNYIKTAVIGNGITRMGGNTFMGCKNLTSVTLPDGLVGIGDLSFYNCENLESITIPDSATYIGAFAFYNCTDIESIKVPDNVTEIWDGAFSGCSGLKKIELNDNLMHLFDQAFTGCKSLTSITIPDSVTSIGKYVFAECTGLKSITIPAKVEYISYSAFENCTKLSGIKVDKNNKKFASDKYGVLYNIDKTILYQYPIGSTATTYTIPGSVTEMYYGAFYGSRNLNSIKVDKNNKSFVSDKYGVLYNVEKTNLIYCPAGNKVTSYIIPNGVMNINKSAFEYCTSLSSVVIPASVQYIGWGAFDNCIGLKKIEVNKNNEDYSSDKCGVLFNKDKTQLIRYPAGNAATSYVIPDSVTEIGVNAFNKSKNIKSITIPVSVTGIYADAFAECSNIKDVYYKGTKAQWNKIALSENNECLTSAFIHFGSGAHTNKETTTKATLSKNGKVVNKCYVCGYSKTTTVYYPKTIKLSTSAYTYDGKVKTPSVIVKDSKGNTLKKDTDYTIKYYGERKAPGKYTVTITFKGKYTGTKKLYFTIVPKTTSKVTPTQSTSAIKLSWSKVTGVTGYRIYQKVDGKWKGIKNTAGTTYTISKLKAGTKYAFAVRPYKLVGEEVIFAKTYTEIETATKCATPTLKVTSTKKGVANISWANVAGETGYQVYMSTKKDSGFQHLSNYKANTTSATKSKLTSGKTYYFRVRAYKKTASGIVYGGYQTVGVRVK